LLRDYPKKKINGPNYEGALGSAYQLTNRHFDIFVDECKYWIKFFGLIGWEINYVFVADDSSRAWVGAEDLEDRLVLIGLAKAWDIRPDAKNLRRSAFHEVCELLVMRYFLLAQERSTNYKDIMEENHNVIRTLENSVFQSDFNRRWPQNKKQRNIKS